MALFEKGPFVQRDPFRKGPFGPFAKRAIWALFLNTLLAFWFGGVFILQYLCLIEVLAFNLWLKICTAARSHLVRPSTRTLQGQPAAIISQHTHTHTLQGQPAAAKHDYTLAYPETNFRGSSYTKLTTRVPRCNAI